jgi:hypothetical protein
MVKGLSHFDPIAAGYRLFDTNNMLSEINLAFIALSIHRSAANRRNRACNFVQPLFSAYQKSATAYSGISTEVLRRCGETAQQNHYRPDHK